MGGRLVSRDRRWLPRRRRPSAPTVRAADGPKRIATVVGGRRRARRGVAGGRPVRPRSGDPVAPSVARPLTSADTSPTGRPLPADLRMLRDDVRHGRQTEEPRELPIGRLSRQTLATIAVGRRVHRRAGPWVPVGADDHARVVEIRGASDLLFVTEAVRDPELHVARRSRLRHVRAS